MNIYYCTHTGGVGLSQRYEFLECSLFGTGRSPEYLFVCIQETAIAIFRLLAYLYLLCSDISTLTYTLYKWWWKRLQKSKPVTGALK